MRLAIKINSSPAKPNASATRFIYIPIRWKQIQFHSMSQNNRPKLKQKHINYRINYFSGSNQSEFEQTSNQLAIDRHLEKLRFIFTFNVTNKPLTGLFLSLFIPISLLLRQKASESIKMWFVWTFYGSISNGFRKMFLPFLLFDGYSIMIHKYGGSIQWNERGKKYWFVPIQVYFEVHLSQHLSTLVHSLPGIAGNISCYK